MKTDPPLAGPNNIYDRRHEFSPVLGAALQKELGEPWYMEASSPGGDYVTWLNLPDGRRVGVSPHLRSDDKVMRWYIALNDAEGDPVQIDHELPISVLFERIAERVREFVARHVPGALS